MIFLFWTQSWAGAGRSLLFMVTDQYESISSARSVEDDLYPVPPLGLG